jgi:hypothetical protein
MSTESQPTEEELRAAYEAEIKKVRIEHVLLEHVVSLVNLGMRRTGLAPGTEDERDPAQVRLAIEAIRVTVPLLEQVAPQQVAPIRDALSQLQLAFVKIGGQVSPEEGPARSGPPGPAPEPAAKPESPGGPGPAQRSGKLWIPGQ